MNRVDREPSYRVDFWSAVGASEEWQLTEVADVTEVLAWAEERADGRTFVVYAEFVHEGGHGMIRLLGAEPPGV
ncbi:hypothetical protein CQ020_22080 [Arthrobacter sp. MYb23]|uniref:hypothetical protein n=1 Tax=unclassified Arthrobacter TaxID=235627 RepID=UPI000CFB0CAA|nr:MULTISPECIES: hypothetical protein [unclassified Arthrobacter]PRB36092.1 hypothetical protein CQ038_21775 [Arthrobacter sp. MYb51]PRB90003.1 hypothetical protein CQ020_22080 [Arthrobacter sp. MYb23]